MSHDAVTLTISTLTGAAVACGLRPRGPTETAVVSEAKVTTATGAVVEGWLTAPHPVPDARMPLMQKLRAAGASHYARVEPIGGIPCTLALDEAAAAALTEAFARAETLAVAGKAAADAERAAHLRASHEVRRVLCAGHSDASYELTEAAYIPDLPGYGPEWQPRLRVGVPGAPSARVHMFAPSLQAVIARSEPWGRFVGHDNSLHAVSVTDWETLVRETARIEARRRAREDAEAARLTAIEVPAHAVQAHKRHRGDAEAAWAADDETGALAIERWRDAIEAQGLADPYIARHELEVHPEGA